MDNSFSGLLIYPNLSEVEFFEIAEASLEDFYLTKLSGGRISDIKDESNKAIIFDFDKGDQDYYPGYVRGRLYPDGKFIGKATYVAGSGIPEEILNGTCKNIKGGIEIKGIWYEQDGKKTGFYLFLTKNGLLPGIKSIPIAAKKQNSAQVKKRNDTFGSILNSELLAYVAKKARLIMAKKSKSVFDHYSHIVELKLKPENRDNMILAISLAYSWMPTMLDIYAKSEGDLNNLLLAIKKIGRIRNLEQFEKQEGKIAEWLTVLTEGINHSIVGASKTLHIFFPEIIPMIDSNVLKSWNSIFKKYYRSNPELKLLRNIPYDFKRAVALYIKYWKLLLCWQYNTNTTGIRQLEEPFYWLGKQKK